MSVTLGSERSRSRSPTGLDAFTDAIVDSPRVQVAKFLLTYTAAGGVNATDVSLRDFLMTTFKVKQLAIATEHQQSGAIHYHVFLVLSERYRGSAAMVNRMFDFEGVKANVRFIKSTPSDTYRVLSYLMKEKFRLITNDGFDIRSYMLKAAKKHHMADEIRIAHIGQHIFTKEPLSKLVKESKITVNQMAVIEKGRIIYEREKPVKHIPGFTFSTARPWVKELYETRIDFPTTRLDFQILWLYGPSGTGKTYVSEMQHDDDGELLEVFKPAARDGKMNFAGYARQRLVVLNDFQGSVTPTNMINCIDGDPMLCRYAADIRLEKGGVFLIVTSNNKPDEVFNTMKSTRLAHYKAFRARVRVLYFPDVDPRMAMASDVEEEFIIGDTTPLPPPSPVATVHTIPRLTDCTCGYCAWCKDAADQRIEARRTEHAMQLLEQNRENRKIALQRQKDKRNLPAGQRSIDFYKPSTNI